MDYTTTATQQNNNQNKRTNLCKVITKKAIREFLSNTERGRDIHVSGKTTKAGVHSPLSLGFYPSRIQTGGSTHVAVLS